MRLRIDRTRNNKVKHIRVLMLAAIVGTAGFSAAQAEEDMKMTVFKTPWCGCCEVWTQAMKQDGYDVTVRDLEDLTAIKKQAQVPGKLEGCHTAVLGEYVLEGHVPLQAIEKLMSERPEIRGIAVPGMPQGSLGMGEDPEAQYVVYAFDRDPSVEPDIFFKAGE
jgi:hypothetical protein